MCTCFERPPIGFHLQHTSDLLERRVPDVAPDSLCHMTTPQDADKCPCPEVPASQYKTEFNGAREGDSIIAQHCVLERLTEVRFFALHHHREWVAYPACHAKPQTRRSL